MEQNDTFYPLSQGYKIMLTGVVNDVVCEVKKAYYNLQYALEARKVAEEMVVRYESFYNQARAFYICKYIYTGIKRRNPPPIIM